MKEHTLNHLEPRGHIHIIFLNTPISEMKKLRRRVAALMVGDVGHPAGGGVAQPIGWGHTMLGATPGMPFSQGQTQNCWDVRLPTVLRHSEFANIIKHRTKS